MKNRIGKSEVPTPAPEHLSDRARAIWSMIVPRRARSTERLTLLQAALEALDRADAARVTIAKEGMTTTNETTGLVHVHPLVKVEREARAQFMSGWAALHLEWDTMIDGRA